MPKFCFFFLLHATLCKVPLLELGSIRSPLHHPYAHHFVSVSPSVILIPTRIELTFLLFPLTMLSLFASLDQFQRSLLLLIDERGRQLKMMFDLQQKKSKGLFMSQNPQPSFPNYHFTEKHVGIL